jgi:hypothetical protein
LNFLDQFSKSAQISHFIKIHPVVAELFHADEWMDEVKLILTFCNFANTPNNDYSAMNFSGADVLMWDTETVFPLRW